MACFAGPKPRKLTGAQIEPCLAEGLQHNNTDAFQVNIMQKTEWVAVGSPPLTPSLATHKAVKNSSALELVITEQQQVVQALQVFKCIRGLALSRLTE